MTCIYSCLWPFALVSMLLVAMCSFSGMNMSHHHIDSHMLLLVSDCYDPLDPNGNFTIIFDTYDWTDDGYLAKVTIQNLFQYRHVDKPGWQIGWIWQQNEVIWSMNGAFATEQGNCSNYKTDIPHSCKKDPEILDLMPDASSDNKSEDCCRSGVLDALAINPSKSFSSFGIKVGNLGGGPFSGLPPLNLTLNAPGPGYTCGPLKSVDPTVSLDFGGRRHRQVFRTWKAICAYSSFLASGTPVCCVSLSSFYNPEITSCPKCSCGCREVTDKNFGNYGAFFGIHNSESCYLWDNSGANFMGALDPVKCTDHMCPIRVHWHVKTSYVDHWRIKLTITNYNYQRNFSNWNVLVQHPGLSMNPITYSFNSTLLQPGFRDAVALFWGIAFVNEELIATDEDGVGSVSTEILLEKDSESFTFKNGWAFPRRVYFNGENCEMPLPDTFPMLPNGTSKTQPPTHWLFLLLIFFISQTLLLHAL
ncbi:unnamed protein product [Prunus armeniaca]|uniref:COBRA-like protein n=1 Tax=Prunus armeniaca TaxID=36596 RepID=A0A6J5Y4R9_PRUAR|nr:unnamed protein product [Prunus armeniaca]